MSPKRSLVSSKNTLYRGYQNRREKTKEIRQRFLIVCEGEKNRA